MKDEESDYQRLLPASSSSSDISNLSDNDQHQAKTTFPGFIVSAICIVCTLINLSLLWFNRTPVWQDVSIPSLFSLDNTLTVQADIEKLRRPSQFVRLDEIYQKFPHAPKNFTNYPLVLTPVDRAQPSKIFASGKGKHVHNFGTVLPEFGHFLLSPTISSIAQFRATDFMMEACELHVKLPEPDPTSSSSLIPSHLELFMLQTGPRLREEKLSYSKRPPRIRKIGDVRFDDGSDWKYNFECARDELFTFELACPKELGVACKLEWTQDKEPATDLTGIFMMQFST